MAEHHYKFNITMTCSGCSGAVDRVLKKMDGLKSYTVDLPSQTADVFTSEAPASDVSYDAVLAKIKKTGKAVTRGERDGVEMAV